MAKKARAKPADPGMHVIQAALQLAAERGWANLALADIAAAAELPLADLYASYPSKTAILVALSRQIDRQVLAGLETGADESTRDRLFDLIMKRFDALAPHREGLSAVARDAGRDPLAALCGLGHLARSMALMLEAAGVSSSGLAGALRTKCLGAIYLATMRDWFRDDSADKARTMAALDARLRRAESWAGRFARRARPAESAS
jgi:AcrR family transcriptional regulator